MITSFDVIIFYDKKLGEGGFAKVYEADWQGTRVAVKKLDENVDPAVRPSVLFSAGSVLIPSRLLDYSTRNRRLEKTSSSSRSPISGSMYRIGTTVLGLQSQIQQRYHEILAP